jgi:peptide/nickel transport system permease protein
MAAVAETPLVGSGHIGRLRTFARRNPTIVAGASLLVVMAVIAIVAGLIAGDPRFLNPSERLRGPSAAHWFGTDSLGRDIYSRTVFGARISLVVGIAVAILAIAFGLAIGLVAGYYRKIDAPVMRLMDGLMAIPSILLAIALVSLNKASVGIVIVAIAVPEVPRVVRLVRAVVLTTREQPFIEAAIGGGSRHRKIILRHILTYVMASAILTEAGLSFLGAGVPPEIPTWGNMIASSRLLLAIAPWTIFFPGTCLALVVLAVNLMGDGLRDRLDPRLARRM